MSQAVQARADARVQAILHALQPNKTAASPAVSPLDEERANPKFPVRELTYYLDGGEAITSIKEMVQSTIVDDPVLNDANRYDITRSEARERTMAKVHQIVGVIRGRNEDLSAQQAAAAKGAQKEAAATSVFDQPTTEEDRQSSRAGAGKTLEEAFYGTLSLLDPSWAIRMGVHFGLFLGALQGSGSPEQWKRYERDIQEMRIIGCFAMTEMGHGSYLQGLETTANYDKTKQEFVINTPTVTATKWWIGMAGETATHAAVYARLLIEGKDCGIQTFLVPIRDLKTGEALPNIKVGDMGSKMGRNGLDNGWIQFNHCRIPRENMLMRWSRVDADGTFHPPPSKQIAYNALIGTRVELFNACSEVLKKAITISIRYSLVRRQFLSKTDAAKGAKGETKLLDYVTHQARLFPILAHTFALHFAAKETAAASEKMLKDMEANISRLPELHATSSGMKALGTWYVNDAIESCRQSLGGMGYSSYAGLSSTRADFAVMCTWEGDNTVLTLQCARFMVKQWANFKRGKDRKEPQGVARYLVKYKEDEKAPTAEKFTESMWLDSAFQIRAFEHRSARLISQAADLIAGTAAREKCSFGVAAEKHAHDLMRVSHRHCYLYMLRCFTLRVNRAPAELKPILEIIRNLFAVSHIEDTLADFMEDEYLTGAHAAGLRRTLSGLLAQMRPHALPLVDSFNMPDFVLDSPLGRFDGDVYNSLFEMVKNAPGAMGVPKYFDKLIKPLTDPDFKPPPQQ